MFFYKLYGLIFRSNTEIEQLLVSGEVSTFDAEIIFGQVPMEIKDYIEQDYTFGYREDAYWFLNNRAVFYVWGGKQIVVEMFDNVPIKSAIPFVLGYCISMLFGQRNRMAVHCSSVKIKDSAVLIAGNSGAGKTSLTTKFLEAGDSFLTDDIAVLDVTESTVTVYPAFPRQNLCEDIVDKYGYDKTALSCVDADRDKYMINRSEQFCDIPSKLHSMFVITTHKGNEVEVEEITGTDKLKIFIDNLFAEHIIRKFGLPATHMTICLKIIQNIKIYLLKRPENIDSTEMQRQKILELV